MSEWRAVKWTRKESRTGTAVSQDVPPEVPSPPKSPTFDTSVMEATGAENQETLKRDQESTTSVESTLPGSILSTVWTLSPLRAVEEPWLFCEVTHDSPTPLDDALEQKLHQLAEASNSPIGDFMLQICQYYIEHESEIAETNTVAEAVQTYLTNEVI